MEKSEGQEWIMEMWKAKENEMDEFKFNVETTVIGTADGKETFEVRKQYNVEGKSAIIYKKNLYSVREQISKNTKCSYSLEQVKTILTRR